MNAKKFGLLALVALMLFSCLGAHGELLDSLPMNDVSFGPKPKDENYLSKQEYQDESISVKIYEGRYADTDYVYAHVKITHPSQLRTIPASIVDSPYSAFLRNPPEADYPGRLVAKAVNAVVAINGDYYTKTDTIHVVMRQSTQVRNVANGKVNLLVIDKNGDFSYLPNTSVKSYQDYYKANKDHMYQVFCFGPMLVKDGVSVIDTNYLNTGIGSQKNAQRAAIAQLGPLEYLLITSSGPQTTNCKGLTIYEFAALCEQVGKELSENGCMLAYNLDGGNSSTLVFKDYSKEYNYWRYVKVNCPDIERPLADIIYFATLVE
ncbi:MAG: phosphodiester glycosidase family protein [Clostridiales bacterium]|nr:phosphodiester glycosidase family protein [Clostridiales bacterium]